MLGNGDQICARASTKGCVQTGAQARALDTTPSLNGQTGSKVRLSQQLTASGCSFIITKIDNLIIEAT